MSEKTFLLSTKVSVLGTGQFGISLATALHNCGYDVIVGSRDPDTVLSTDKLAPGLCITTVQECICAGEIVFMAVHAEHMVPLIRQHVTEAKGKIFVDVSNTTKKGKLSNTEILSTEFPQVTFVKAFSKISAFDFEDISNCDRKICIASDSAEANMKIHSIANSLGLNAISYRSLNNARDIEVDQNSLFGGWGSSLRLVICVFIFWLIYGSFRHHILKGKPWNQLPINTMNKIMGATALTTLPLCYLPGSIARLIQLLTNTKHLHKHQLLINWLNMRKQLGLLNLWLASVHCILSVAHLSPAYFNKWYSSFKVVVPANHTSDVIIATSLKMEWYGELCILLGVVSLGAMTVVGVTSIGSVGSKMNRKQWTVVHSWVGHICLFSAAAHVTTKAVPSWGISPFTSTIQCISFITLLLPYITLLLRFLVIGISCMKSKLQSGGSIHPAKNTLHNETADENELNQLNV